MSLHVDRLDHLVLTVRDLERTYRFYQQVLGMEVVAFGAGRLALRFGQQKINLHIELSVYGTRRRTLTSSSEGEEFPPPDAIRMFAADQFRARCCTESISALM